MIANYVSSWACLQTAARPARSASAGQQLPPEFAVVSVLCLLGFALVFLLFALWIFTIVDIMRSEFSQSSNKTAWLLLVLMLAPLGILLYWIMGAKQKMRLPPVTEFDPSFRGRRRSWEE